eukprot:10460441-Karenia_brevis.AAC.1
MRHGGPSHDRLTKVRSILEIKQLGRWSRLDTMKRYEAAGRVQQEEAKVPKAALQEAQLAQQNLALMVRNSFLPRQLNIRNSCVTPGSWSLCRAHPTFPKLRLRPASAVKPKI